MADHDAGRADAIRWLFYLSSHIGPPTVDLVFNRLAVKLRGLPGDEDAIARGEKALPDALAIVEARLAKHQWIVGDEFSLVECAYGPMLNAVEGAGFGFQRFPRLKAYLDAIRARPAYQQTPRLPML